MCSGCVALYFAQAVEAHVAQILVWLVRLADGTDHIGLRLGRHNSSPRQTLMAFFTSDNWSRIRCFHRLAVRLSARAVSSRISPISVWHLARGDFTILNRTHQRLAESGCWLPTPNPFSTSTRVTSRSKR